MILFPNLILFSLPLTILLPIPAITKNIFSSLFSTLPPPLVILLLLPLQLPLATLLSLAIPLPLTILLPLAILPWLPIPLRIPLSNFTFLVGSLSEGELIGPSVRRSIGPSRKDHQCILDCKVKYA